MTVIKRSRNDSNSDLVKAIQHLVPYLKDQKEHDAAADLEKAATTLTSSPAGSPAYIEAINLVVEAFEGDHELIAYTFQRDNGGQWTEAEELSQASARVLSLAKRLQSTYGTH